MIDIHSHIIYGVDDGPETLEESLALLQESYRQGVRTIVATSHRRKGMFETPEEIISQHFLTVRDEAAKHWPDLKLLYGAEIYYTQDVLQKLVNKTFPTMNGTRFVLIEFSLVTPWRDIHSALQMILMSGITPIIAHLERYNALEGDKKKVQELIDMGCYVQVNAAHILKPKFFKDDLRVFKKRVAYLLEENLVHLVSSDMHNTDTRPPFMDKAYALVRDKYGKQHADKLFKEHAATLLENQLL